MNLWGLVSPVGDRAYCWIEHRGEKGGVFLAVVKVGADGGKKEKVHARAYDTPDDACEKADEIRSAFISAGWIGNVQHGETEG